MKVSLRFFATFREAVGQKVVEHEYPDDATVGDVLRALEEEYDGLEGRLVEDGDLAPQINVLWNGREVLHERGMDTELSDGDTLSVFPPVAGGADGAEEWTAREKSFRGISVRLAREYLENLGGEAVADDRVEADAWTAELDDETVEVGPTMELTEVTVSFEGDPDVLDDLVEDFSQKAMRAGG